MYTYLEQKAPKFCYFLEYYGLQYSCSSLISFLAFPRHLNVFYNPLGTNECIQIAAASNQLAPSFYAQCSLKMGKQCEMMKQLYDFNHLTRNFCTFIVQYICVYMTRISDSICAADITLERDDVKKVQHFFPDLRTLCLQSPWGCCYCSKQGRTF